MFTADLRTSGQPADEFFKRVMKRRMRKEKKGLLKSKKKVS